MQYSYETIKVATDDFSEKNKLGEGGFGVVYKVRISQVVKYIVFIHSGDCCSCLFLVIHDDVFQGRLSDGQYVPLVGFDGIKQTICLYILGYL